MWVCGLGTWLHACRDLGVEDIIGVDGPYVNIDKLHIAKHEFFSADLNEELDLRRSFDMAISLECAEHIELNNAEQFVKNLTNHSDLILFSQRFRIKVGPDMLMKTGRNSGLFFLKMKDMSPAISFVQRFGTLLMYLLVQAKYYFVCKKRNGQSVQASYAGRNVNATFCYSSRNVSLGMHER